MTQFRVLNFKSETMKRLFYFSGYRLKVFLWKNRYLQAELSFQPDNSGLNAFRKYLQQSVNIPTKFLVDVIEEDFRIEKVPHVGSKDRKAVISRLIDRFYRSSQQYCYHEVIGRDKTGRKDDQILIGAMTNPQLIQPWLSIIDECDVPVSGIWSLPLISSLLLNKIDANKGITLLVSQQVNSNVRQSLFRNGKLLSSRQSIISQDIRDTENSGFYIAPEVEKTLMFFRNQRLLSDNEIVNLHVIGSEKQLKSLQQVFVSDEKQKTTVHSTVDIIKKLKLKNIDDGFSDGIFSWICSNQPFKLSHYGHLSQFNHYYYSIASAVLYMVSTIIFVLGFLLIEYNISSALGDENEINLLKKTEHEYRKVYAKNFKPYEAVFENADMMNSAVILAQRIKYNSKTSPLDFMLQLSQIISDKTLPDIEIDRIQWRPANTDKMHHVVNDPNAKAVDFTENTPILHQAIIKGRINVNKNNYRESVSQLDAIIKALKTYPSVVNVLVKTMPVDLRSSSRFSSESGINIKHRKNNQATGIFSLQVTMRASSNG